MTDFSSRSRAIVCSYQPYYVGVMERLTKRFGWQPSIWFVADENRKAVQEAYPGALAYEYFEAVKGRIPADLNESDLQPISPEELIEIQSHEFNFLYMLERNDSNYSAFKHQERYRFYIYVLSIWKTLIKKYEIEIVLFEEEPHQAVDYGLYAVAKLLDIPTVMTIRTIAELGVLPSIDFQAGYPALNRQYKCLCDDHNTAGETLEISASVERYFEKLNSDYFEVAKEHLFDQVEEYGALTSKLKPSLPGFSAVGQAANKFFEVGKKFIVNPPIRNDQFKNGAKLQESRFAYRDFVISKMKAIYKKRSLRKIYCRLATSNLTNLPRGKKYLYLALQYQPEKSTCPLAGRFVDQIYLVKWLSSNLDESWHIIVKEHPSQFISAYSRFGECFRSEEYYLEIAALPNVTLLALSIDSFQAMECSQVVASAGGTVCWEAVARGLPAMSFAHSWFKSCHGVFYIEGKKQLVECIAAIENGFKPDTYLVRAFAQLIANYGFSAAVGGYANLEHHGLSAQKNAENLFNAIASLVEKDGCS